MRERAVASAVIRLGVDIFSVSLFLFLPFSFFSLLSSLPSPPRISHNSKQTTADPSRTLKANPTDSNSPKMQLSLSLFALLALFTSSALASFFDSNSFDDDDSFGIGGVGGSGLSGFGGDDRESFLVAVSSRNSS